MSRKKISLIGAGNIGGTMAHLIMKDGLGDVILFDVNEGVAKGKALDILQTSSIDGVDCSIVGTSNYEEIQNSDVVIITAGVPRKPGMSRDDLIGINAGIIKTVAENVKKHSPESFIIVVTNPLDTMVQHFYNISGLNSKKVVGMAGVLDSARFKYFLSQEFNVSVKDVNAFVLGGHGDTMVPVLTLSTIAGISIPDMIKMGYSSEENINKIVNRTRNGGGEVVSLLGNGSAFYAPATSALEMAKSYIFDRKQILPCAVKLNGQYGVNDGVYIGVPVVIGKNGVEKIVEVSLDKSEKEMFDKSIDATRNLVNLLK